jgi:hypothetical protein
VDANLARRLAVDYAARCVSFPFDSGEPYHLVGGSAQETAAKPSLERVRG